MQEARRVQERLQDIEAQLRERPDQPGLREEAARLGDLRRQLEAKFNSIRHEGQLAEREHLEHRVRGMLEAAEILERTGSPDEAQRLRELAHRGGAHMPPGGPGPHDPRVQELAEQLEHMRGELHELRMVIRELAERGARGRE